jgi:hypothetical protein
MSFIVVVFLCLPLSVVMAEVGKFKWDSKHLSAKKRQNCLYFNFVAVSRDKRFFDFYYTDLRIAM